MTNVTTIDSQLAERAAYILHLNTGTKAVPCTKLTEELLRAWDRADTIAADCTERQQRLMIEEARKVIRKLHNRCADLYVCWSTHVDAADANGVALQHEPSVIDTNEIDWDTLTIRQFRVAQARNRILDRLERDHGDRWACKLVVASDRMATLSLLLQQPQFRSCPVMRAIKADLRCASSQLERVRAHRDGDPRIAAGELRRAIDAANAAINAAREKPQQRQLRELQLGAQFKRVAAEGTRPHPTAPVYTVHKQILGCRDFARELGVDATSGDVTVASFRQSDGYLAGPFHFNAWTYVYEL